MRGWTARLESGRWVGWLGALALAFSGFTLTARLAPYSEASVWTAYFVGFGAVVTCALGVAVTVPAGRRVCAGLAVLGLAGLVLAQRLGGGDARFILLALLALGSGLGGWVGSGIEQPGHLLFVAVISSLADTFSVTHPDGPSAMIARQPQALALLALSWPMLGTRDVVPLLGVGDVVFTALYWSAARKHALAWQRTLLALSCAYLVTVIAVVALERAIPVLPLMGICMLAAHASARTPPAADRKRGLWTIAALSFVLAVWVLRR
jgi:hypothetical protein